MAENTRNQVLELLRRGVSTVNELAAALELTDNAVRSHLAALERQGFVQQSGEVPGVRRPHATYALTSAGEALFPKAYGPVLIRLLDVLGDRLPRAKVEALLREAGRSLGGDLAKGQRRTGLRDRAEGAVQFLKDLGGLADVEERDGRVFIRGYSCPLASIVAAHPEACHFAEELLSALLGEPVKEQCEKGESPRCCFEVLPPAG